MTVRGSLQGRSVTSALAVIGVSVPFLVYFSAPRFGDEMRDPYTMTARYGLNPVKIIVGNLKDIGPFLELGNIRPLGRIVYSFEFVYSKGLADALGVPLPSIHAIVRATALWAAVVSIAALWTAVESNGQRIRPSLPRSVGLVACAAAAATLATWSYQPLVFFPTQGLLSVALVCLATALTLRLSASGGWRLAVGCAVLGAACACFYDLAYVVAVTATVALAGLRVIQKRSGLPRASWFAGAPLLIGFGVVFVPIRILIMRACAEQACYSGSEVEVTAKAVPTLAARLLSALPQTYWRMGWEFLAWRSVIVAPLVGLAVAMAALWAVRRRHDNSTADSDTGVIESSALSLRVSSALVALVMIAAWVTAAAMSALSASQQKVGFDPHAPWRDGIFGFLVLATLLWALIEHVASARSSQRLRLTIALVAVLAGTQFALNTAAIAQSRELDPNPVYGRVDDLFASSVSDDEVCDLADDLYDLAQKPGRRYYTTALLESLKRLKPIDDCRAYQAPLPLEEWHMRQLGDLD